MRGDDSLVRCKCQIISDILKTIKREKNCKKTRVIRFANLDWNMADKYLGFLLENNYLETYEDGRRGNESYGITEEGRELLKTVNKVKNMCEDLG